MKKKLPDDYLSYLLRLWPANNGEAHAWRISLESTRTRQRHGFASIDELVAYLRLKMELGAEPDPEKHT